MRPQIIEPIDDFRFVPRIPHPVHVVPKPPAPVIPKNPAPRTPPKARGGGSCPPHYTRVGSVCLPPRPAPPPVTCPPGHVLVRGKCVVNVPPKPPKPKPLVCPVIECPHGYYVSGHRADACHTPICGPILPAGKCPPGQYPVDGVCEVTHVQCGAGGYVDASGNCVPAGAPVPVNGVCPTGWQIDSAGNCTPAGSEANPYSLYLPSGDTPSTSATDTAAPAGCATGSFQDLAGACWPDTLVGWLEASTLVAGVPNMEIVGGVAVAGLALYMMTRSSGKGSRR